MICVLGIDAAWSARNASGVALLQRVGSRWQCRGAAASQSEFLGRIRPKVGDPATPAALLAASQALRTLPHTHARMARTARATRGRNQ